MAVGVRKTTPVEKQSPRSAIPETGAGHVIAGPWVSVIVNVACVVLKFPQPSVAVKITVVASHDVESTV